MRRPLSILYLSNSCSLSFRAFPTSQLNPFSLSRHCSFYSCFSTSTEGRRNKTNDLTTDAAACWPDLRAKLTELFLFSTRSLCALKRPYVRAFRFPCKRLISCSTPTTTCCSASAPRSPHQYWLGLKNETNRLESTSPLRHYFAPIQNNPFRKSLSGYSIVCLDKPLFRFSPCRALSVIHPNSRSVIAVVLCNVSHSASLSSTTKLLCMLRLLLQKITFNKLPLVFDYMLMQ